MAVTNDDVKKILSKMTYDVDTNIKTIKKEVCSLAYEDEHGLCLLHIFVDEKYDEELCFLGIQALLKVGLNPNKSDWYEYNFIQNALYTGYSEEFILKIIKESLKYGLDVNHVDYDKDTIMHTAIYSDNYKDEVINIYKLLVENEFDSTKVDGDKNNILEAMEVENFTVSQINEVKEIFQKVTDGYFDKEEAEDVENNISQIKNIEIQSLTVKQIQELEKFGRVLNKKQFNTAPTIGREKELENLIITLAQKKKNPLLVGEPGVGKTVLAEELAYRIQNNQVPNFLKGKVILEVTPSELVSGCSYVGMFEKKMTELMKLCEKYEVILLINEIHTIFGVGSTDKQNNDMASMLKYYIDSSNLKVIGTTTNKEYTEYFSSDALKRRFSKISLLEPKDEVLYRILNKVINDYSLETGINFKNESIKEEVIDIIVKATAKKVQMNPLYNPDLSIYIIDKAFAFTTVYDSEFITPEHFVKSFELTDELYDSTRQDAISRLNNIEEDIVIEKQPTKIIKFKPRY